MDLPQRRNRKRVLASRILVGLSTLQKQQPSYCLTSWFLLCGMKLPAINSHAGCGGTLYGDSGSFTSPGYPGTYPNHTHCEWTIIAPSERLVTISFYFISIDDPGDCVQNYLILFDGPDINSPSSGPYCGAVSNTDFLDCHILCLNSESNSTYF